MKGENSTGILLEYFFNTRYRSWLILKRVKNVKYSMTYDKYNINITHKKNHSDKSSKML